MFCTVPNGKYGDYKDLSPLATFIESEGLTLVVSRENADTSGLQYESGSLLNVLKQGQGKRYIYVIEKVSN